MKHEYSTYTIILFIFVALAVFTIGIGSDELDEVCETDNSIMKRIAGLWICQQTHYGEMYYHNSTNPLSVSITNTEVYYPVTGLSLSNLQGISYDGTNFTISKNATYDIIATMSFYGGNAGDYEVELFVNGVENSDCGFHRTTTNNAVGDATLSCLKTLSINDKICIKIEDLGAPAQNVNIESINFKIVEII